MILLRKMILLCVEMPTSVERFFFSLIFSKFSYPSCIFFADACYSIFIDHRCGEWDIQPPGVSLIAYGGLPLPGPAKSHFLPQGPFSLWHPIHAKEKKTPSKHASTTPSTKTPFRRRHSEMRLPKQTTTM